MRLTMAPAHWHYVALGDAVGMDVRAGGPGLGAASLLLRNRDDAFPDWRGRDLTTATPGARLIPLAADGATAAAVRYAQLPRLREMRVRPRLVTLSVGGDDLWQTFGDEAAARTAHRALWDHGSAVLADLRAMCEPDAPILVATPPAPGGDAPPFLSAWGARFDETLRTLAGEHGATIADLSGGAGDAPSVRAVWWRALAGLGFVKEAEDGGRSDG